MSTRVNELIECDLSDVRLIATAPFLIEKAEECIPSCYRSRAYLGRELTKYVIVVMSALLLFGATALAQEGAASEAETASAAEPAPEPQQEEKKRSPYYRKARGWLWIEAFAGPSRYDPDKFGSLSISGIQNAPRLNGPEYGFAFGTPFGGPFFLGFFYRQANYGLYKLLKTGLDMQGSIMIPYVHIILRGSIGFAKTFPGNPYGLTSVDNGGVSFTGGFGCENSDHSLDLICGDPRLDIHRLVVCPLRLRYARPTKRVTFRLFESTLFYSERSKSRP